VRLFSVPDCWIEGRFLLSNDTPSLAIIATPPAPQPITLAAGETNAVRVGVINPSETIQFVINAPQGSVLGVKLTAPANEVSIGVTGPTGLALKPLDPTPTWNTTVTTGGDHYITLTSVAGTSSKSYTLEVSLTPPNVPATATATLPSAFQAKVSRPSSCYNGPSENYIVATIVPADTEVNLLGTNSDGKDWFMIQSSTIARCWLQADALLLDNIDTNRILILTTAFTTVDSSCRTGPGISYTEQTYIPQGWRIVVYAKNDLTANWVLVTPHDSTEQCWIATTQMTQFDSSGLIIEPAPVAVTTTPIDLAPIDLSWKIISYDCNQDGNAVGALMDLIASGGLPPYSYSHTLPLYVQPGQSVSIKVNSATVDGEPSSTIGFTFPSDGGASVFKCDKPGTNPGPTSQPKPPTSVLPTKTQVPPTKTRVPPTPTLCWPPGHCR
jgi:uncharacterized protein YraI